MDKVVQLIGSTASRGKYFRKPFRIPFFNPEAWSMIEEADEKWKIRLPRPNVKFVRSGHPPRRWSAEDVRGVICNPVYTGMGPFPRAISDELWVKTAVISMEKESKEQFLVNLLYILRETFGWPEGEK